MCYFISIPFYMSHGPRLEAIQQNFSTINQMLIPTSTTPLFLQCQNYFHSIHHIILENQISTRFHHLPSCHSLRHRRVKYQGQSQHLGFGLAKLKKQNQGGKTKKIYIKNLEGKILIFFFERGGGAKVAPPLFDLYGFCGVH